MDATSLDRALTLLAAVCRDDGRTPTAALASEVGLPPSTARRLTAQLEAHGLLERVARGRRAAGPAVEAWAAARSPHRRLVALARPLLRRLTGGGATAHLGVLEGGMVTYLAKEGGADLFTREGLQLEAYCTGIGKALLAHAPQAELQRYLAGEFVALTPHTLTETGALEVELRRTRARGYAVDDREIAVEVRCVAVPVLVDERAVAALSVSDHPDRLPLASIERLAARLARLVATLGERLSRSRSPATRAPDPAPLPPPPGCADHRP